MTLQLRTVISAIELSSLEISGVRSLPEEIYFKAPHRPEEKKRFLNEMKENMFAHRDKLQGSLDYLTTFFEMNREGAPREDTEYYLTQLRELLLKEDEGTLTLIQKHGPSAQLISDLRNLSESIARKWRGVLAELKVSLKLDHVVAREALVGRLVDPRIYSRIFRSPVVQTSKDINWHKVLKRQIDLIQKLPNGQEIWTEVKSLKSQNIHSSKELRDILFKIRIFGNLKKFFASQKMNIDLRFYFVGDGMLNSEIRDALIRHNVDYTSELMDESR